MSQLRLLFEEGGSSAALPASADTGAHRVTVAEHVVRITCRDAPGIICRVSGLLFERGANIIEQDEYVDRSTNRFFMRTRVTGALNMQSLACDLQALDLREAAIGVVPLCRKRLVLFCGSEPHCLGDLLLRHAYQELPADILAVVSNRPDLQPLAARFDVPFHLVSHEGRARTEHEQAILEVVSGFHPDYLVLARYMRILSADFVRNFPERIVNIHHSFLPAFVGSRPYHRAFERGVKIIGATAHFVTDGLDEGPIIAQDVQPVSHRKTVQDLIHAGRDIEKKVLARALRLVLEDRVFVHENRTIVFE